MKSWFEGGRINTHRAGCLSPRVPIKTALKTQSVNNVSRPVVSPSESPTLVTSRALPVAESVLRPHEPGDTSTKRDPSISAPTNSYQTKTSQGQDPLTSCWKIVTFLKLKVTSQPKML